MHLLLFFLHFTGAWDRIELRIHAAVRNAIIFYLDKKLQVDFFLCWGTLNHDWCALNLDKAVVFNIDLARHS